MYITTINIRLGSNFSIRELMIEDIRNACGVLDQTLKFEEFLIDTGDEWKELVLKIHIKDQSKVFEFVDLISEQECISKNEVSLSLEFQLSEEANGLPDDMIDPSTIMNSVMNQLVVDMDDLSEDVDGLTERVAAIEGYIKRSGVLYYESFIKAFLAHLEASDNTEIDVHGLRKTMLPPTH